MRAELPLFGEQAGKSLLWARSWAKQHPIGDPFWDDLATSQESLNPLTSHKAFCVVFSFASLKVLNGLVLGSGVEVIRVRGLHLYGSHRRKAATCQLYFLPALCGSSTTRLEKMAVTGPQEVARHKVSRGQPPAVPNAFLPAPARYFQKEKILKMGGQSLGYYLQDRKQKPGVFKLIIQSLQNLE